MSEELDSAALQSIETKLRSLASELENALAGPSDAHKPVDLDQPFGRVSRIDAIQQQQMAKAARAAQKRQLVQVKAALDSIAHDEYGMCRICEEPIATARLLARPEAPFCLDCQRQRER